MERILLRPAEAADLIGVSRSTLYELLARGALPSVRLGHSIRVPLEALLRLAQEGASGAGELHDPAASANDLPDKRGTR